MARGVPDSGLPTPSKLEPPDASGTDSIRGLAIDSSVMMWTEGLEKSRPYLERLRRQDTARWSESDRPIETATLLSQVFSQVGGDDWRRWSRVFYPDLLRNQCVKGDLGWWTAEGLGIDDTSEIDGMTSEEGAIYTTSLMLLAYNQIYSFRHVCRCGRADEDDEQLFDDDDDLDIDIF